MMEYRITPWGTAEEDSSPLPPPLEKLAYEVLAYYPLKVKNMQLITSKPDKGGAIWRVESAQGVYSLKLLHRAAERSLFSIGAQRYLTKQGARVPALIKTKQDRMYVEAGGKLWIVSQWIEPLQQASKIDLQGAQTLCHGLGEFHRHSRGYQPPRQAKISSRLHRWPVKYQKMINKMDWFRNIAIFYNDAPASAQLLQALPLFEQQAKDALQQLLRSSYAELVQKGESYWGLVHQDYGWSNGQLGPGGVWIIDLDGVAYDLPIRDLRKLITSTMDDLGVWDLTWIKGMISAYHNANPIEDSVYEILLIDMALPNEFYKHVKDVIYDPATFLNAETEALIRRTVQVDASKWNALKELKKWRVGKK